MKFTQIACVVLGLVLVAAPLVSAADFFFNDVTGKSQWEEPAEPVAYEDDQGRKYWYDSKSDASQWEVVHHCVGANIISRLQHAGRYKAPAHLARVLSNTGLRFPGPWEEVQSEEHGQPYFYNKEKDETTWEKPEVMGWRRVVQDEL